MRRTRSASTWTKSAARMPRAWAVRNCFQVGPVRRGAGPIPASCRICHTVDAAIGWPSLTSWPCTCRCPHAGLSVAMRITSLRIAAAVDGRPGPPARVIPPAGDKSPVPREQRRRCHREHLSPPPPGDQLGQCREPQPVAPADSEPGRPNAVSHCAWPARSAGAECQIRPLPGPRGWVCVTRRS